MAIQPKIFELFFTTNAAGPGTGLGLSISKAIVEQDSGAIELCHFDADGILFSLQYPIALEK
ncbi:MAG: two-component system NtrC family sensor kinase [Flavobacteriales bacterium]